MRISLLEQLYLQLALRQESLRRGLFVFFEIFLIYHRLSQIILITFLKTPAAFDGQVAENAQRRQWLLPGFLDAWMPDVASSHAVLEKFLSVVY